MTLRTPLQIWAISDGRTGMENQALGLAEAVARRVPSEITVKRVQISSPFDRLPRWMWGQALNRVSHGGDRLTPPWPDLWIACGRRTVPLSMAVRGRGPFVVQTQDPKAPLAGFDLVVPPRHDQLAGRNVVSIIGSPNRLTEQRLAEDAARLEAALPPLPRPMAAVLLGGASKDFAFSGEAIRQLVLRLQAKVAGGFGLLITPSRRTNPEVLTSLREALPGSKVWIWEGQRVGALANPYFGILGLATEIMVTEESANMITDAAFTGKPVTLLPLEGGTPKWCRFHADLAAAGVTSGQPYSPIRETDRVAAIIVDRLSTPG